MKPHHLVLACAVLLSIALRAHADTTRAGAYPDHWVKVIVPYPAGGPIDLATRILGQKLSQDWSQPVVIENRAGGSSAVGASIVAHAPPDGYTLLAAMDTTLVFNPITVPNLSYDPKAFAPISLTTNNTPLLIVPAAGPRSTRELIDRAKSAPGKLTYGAGVLPARLAGYLFNKLAKIQTTEVVYHGSAEIVEALLNGSINYSFDGLSASLPMISAGKLRPLAKLAAHPLSPFPALPKLSDDAGLPALADISVWSGIVAPAGTPPAIVGKIQKSIARALAEPEVADRLDKMGISVLSSTPDEFQRLIDEETMHWTKIIRDGGLKMQ